MYFSYWLSKGYLPVRLTGGHFIAIDLLFFEKQDDCLNPISLSRS